jgi:hypothetical protein
MSKSSKKVEDRVFDKTGFADRRAKSIDQEWRPESDELDLIRVAKSISGGSVQHAADDDSLIGHNQGPPLDEAEADASADTDTQPVKRGRRVSGSKLTKEAIAWLRAREKSGELEKVIWDSPYGSKVVENFERRQTGASRNPESGKWRNPDGLVSRRGHRRVFPEDKQWLDENNIQALRLTAARVLHGRNATVFEKHVTNPLIGLPKSSVGELAAQFGVTEKKIYKILERCKDRVKRAMRGEALPPGIKRSKMTFVEVREYIDGKPPPRPDEDASGRRYIDFLFCPEHGIWLRKPDTK